MGSKLIKSDGTFSFFIPLQKSAESDDDRRIVEGIASTEHTDLQNEKVLQKGINIDYFVNRGKLNWDHKAGPENIIGEPVECKHTSKGLYVKGLLYKGHPRADATWELANAMAKSGSKHGLGFSIQGKVIQKSSRPDGHKVVEACWLQELAITAHPINTSTYMDIVKALSEQEWATSSSAATPEAIKSLEASSAGFSVPVKTEETLRVESLDGKAGMHLHKSACKCQECKHDQISKAQAVEYIQQNYDVSQQVAQILADSAFYISELD